MERDRTLFTIGQFAEIHGITKKTLMWYDEMGLVKPAVIGENGYRYYSYYQSSMLETILMLRELDVSILEIKLFMEQRSAENMERLLAEKKRELEEKITYLKRMEKTLESRHQDMLTLLNLNLSEFQIVKKEKAYLAVVPLGQEEPTAVELEQVIAVVKQHKLKRLHDAVYGSMISVNDLRQKKYDDYEAIYVELSQPVSKKGLHVQPAGTYLRAFYQGPWEALPRRYEEIFSYADAQGLSLYGYAYETGINESVIRNFDEYITQIEIPIRQSEGEKTELRRAQPS